MNRTRILNLTLAVSLFAAQATAAQTIVVATQPNAAGPERLAAQELAGYLGKLYPATSFEVKTEPPASGSSR